MGCHWGCPWHVTWDVTWGVTWGFTWAVTGLSLGWFGMLLGRFGMLLGWFGLSLGCHLGCHLDVTGVVWGVPVVSLGCPWGVPGVVWDVTAMSLACHCVRCGVPEAVIPPGSIWFAEGTVEHLWRDALRTGAVWDSCPVSLEWEDGLCNR